MFVVGCDYVPVVVVVVLLVVEDTVFVVDDLNMLVALAIPVPRKFDVVVNGLPRWK